MGCGVAVYILLPLAAVLFGIPLCKNFSGRAVYCVLTGIALFIISAIRYNVGYDYPMYSYWYERARITVPAGISTWKQEKGFLLTIKYMADAGLSERYMFAGIALVIAVLFTYLLLRYSSKPWVSVTAFLIFGLYFNSMNFMRQFVAALIISIAFRYVWEKRPLRFLALILFASTIHVSALIMIPFYFLLKLRLNWKLLCGFSALGAAALIFSQQILAFVTTYFYTQYDTASDKELLTGTPPIYAIFVAVFFIIAFLLRKMLAERDPAAHVYITALFFALLLEVVAIKHGVVARLALPLLILPVIKLSADMFLILCALFEKTFKGSRRAVVLLSGFCIAIVFAAIGGGYYAYLLSVGYNGVLPYKTIFGEGGALL